MRVWRDFAIIPLVLSMVGWFTIDGNAQTAANDPAKSPAPVMSGNQRARFTGTYRYPGSAQEEEARRVAIDHAVEGFSFVTRSTARNRVSATTQILGFYTFSFEPGKIVVRPQSRPEMISGDKGEPADYVYNGKHSTLTQVLAGDHLTQIFVSDDGRRKNEFTVSQDGRTVTLKVTLTSGRLSSSVAYSLSYKKAD